MAISSPSPKPRPGCLDAETISVWSAVLPFYFLPSLRLFPFPFSFFRFSSGRPTPATGSIITPPHSINRLPHSSPVCQVAPFRRQGPSFSWQGLPLRASIVILLDRALRLRGRLTPFAAGSPPLHQAPPSARQHDSFSRQGHPSSWQARPPLVRVIRSLDRLFPRLSESPVLVAGSSAVQQARPSARRGHPFTSQRRQLSGKRTKCPPSGHLASSR
jgi:hypothetical protein